MRRDDAKCTKCAWEGEVTSANLEDRATKRCAAMVEELQDDDGVMVVAGAHECGGELEFLPGGGSGGITRFGFGFSPSFGDGRGNNFGPGKRRPATAKKG